MHRNAKVTSKKQSGGARDEIEQIAEQLLRYLDLNPAAKDTKEGIAKWWIARQRIAESLKAVDAALALLIERGEVLETALADGTKVYGRREPPNNS
jgi:hypothetical protein